MREGSSALETRPPHRVSVIIATRNRQRLLVEAIESVRALEGPDLDLEILVVDNGSTDDTVEVATNFGARVLHCATPGSPATRNVGIRAATGDYLAFLDDDDLWLPEHLRPELALLDARPELMAVIGQIVPTDEAGNVLDDPYPIGLPENGDAFEPLLVQWPQIGAVVTRTAVRDTVGYLDESLTSGADWDWLLKIALKHRWGHVAVPAVLLRSRPVATTHEDNLNLSRARVDLGVFWRNVWRGSGRRISPLRVLRAALRYHGVFAGYFLRSSIAYDEAGNPAAASRSVIHAVTISPLHVVWAVARRPSMLTWMVSLLLRARGH